MSKSHSAASNEENLECIAESVKAAVAAGKEALVDCEHFFDGYKANPRLCDRLREDGAMRLARAGSSSVTPMAARSRRKSAPSSKR